MPASQFLRGAQERAQRPVTRLWYLLDITEHPLLLLLVRLGPGIRLPPLPLKLLQVLLWSTSVLHQATQVRLDKLLVTFDLVHTISPAPGQPRRSAGSRTPLRATSGPEPPPSFHSKTPLGAILLPPHLRE